MLAETQETDVEVETQETEVEETNIARLWFKKHAWFRVPPYEPPSSSRFSGSAQDVRIDQPKPNLPTLAFYDKEKTERFMVALDHALGDSRLKAGSMSPDITRDKEIEAIYEKLFSPGCEKRDGLMLIEWERIANEGNANRLTLNALMNAVVAVTVRMFEKDITVRTESMCPYQDQTTKFKPRLRKEEGYKAKERVDMIVTGETGRNEIGTKEIKKEDVLYLMEGMNPDVIEGLAAMFRKGNTVEIGLYNNRTNGRKILNKVIYYMLSWDIPLLVVTSFSTAFILELHRTEEGCFVSCSPRIDADKSTKLFRAILGLTLVALKIVDYEQFTVDAALAAYKRQQAVEKADSCHTRSAGGRGGATSRRGASGSKSGSGSSKKRGSGASTKKTSGKDTCTRNRKNSTTKNGTKRPLDISTVDGMASTAAREPGNSVICLEDSEEFTVGTGLHQMEFVRDAKAPFPALPTLDRVPCLTLRDEITWGSAGTVYYSELRAPQDENASSFIIKIIDARLRSHTEYRNAFKELLKEYETYYLLGQLKRDNKCSDIIENTTPTCYGLYRARHRRRDVFALVIAYAGEVTLNPSWKQWELSDKSATLASIICLHSLGLFHGDVAERNVALKRDDNNQVENAKFFEFDNSSWHQCCGVEECEELEDVWYLLFPDDDAPFDRHEFEERATSELDREVVVQRLKKLSEAYDEEHDYAM